MHQFTAKLSRSYPQQQVHQMLGVHQGHGQNQNFWRAPEPPIKQEFHIQPEQPSSFESAEYGEARTSDDWPRQTGITPFQGPAEPMIKRDSHAQEGQLMVYDDRQSPFARNAWSTLELALFLLVLALGKIYDRKENPAHAFYEGGEQPGGSASLRNSYPSPEEVDKSWTDRHPSGNMDITAGLDYFAAATNIIGNIDDRDS
ncbi:hypothetical protein IFR05_014520 [Cadophora sp. M221]|nr:hypothetical protein IFR05_014520 [Cadophora sp. M221]